MIFQLRKSSRFFNEKLIMIKRKESNLPQYLPTQGTVVKTVDLSICSEQEHVLYVRIVGVLKVVLKIFCYVAFLFCCLNLAEIILCIERDISLQYIQRGLSKGGTFFPVIQHLLWHIGL